MNKKKHSRSFQGKSSIKRSTGVFTAFSPDSWSYQRLVWYTTNELTARRKKMIKYLETLQNPVLRKKMRYELKTIKSILS